MIVEINDDQTIIQIQSRFHHCYPFLKIDFFEKESQIYTKEKQYKAIEDTSKSMGEFRLGKSNTDTVTIQSDMKVREIENAIDQTYGLRAQIFRRSGNVWLETTVTGNWSLEEQNRQGEMITTQMQG